MPNLRIPEKDLTILKVIAELTEDQFRSLNSGVGNARATLQQAAFVTQISETTQGLQAVDVNSIIRVLFILYRMKDRKRMTASQLSDEVITPVKREGKLPDDKVALLRQRLEKLLSFEQGISVTAKALDVMTQHEHVFCSARIVSDIRPVFTNSLDSPSAGVIIHNLQIGFHDGGSGPHKEIYIALDSKDVQELKEVLSRAEKKDAALQSILKASQIAYLGDQ